jgi:hypothetical protein
MSIFNQNYRAVRNTAHVTSGKQVSGISGVRAVNPFTTYMEERERCNSFISSRTPHEANTLYKFVLISFFNILYIQPTTTDLVELRKRARVRFSHSRNMCMNMSVCIGSGCILFTIST